MARSRFIVGKPASTPLCIHSQLLVAERVAVGLLDGRAGGGADVGEDPAGCAWAHSSRRLRSFQAGSVLRNSPGVSQAPYQPTPNPSPLVVVAPSCECLLCTTREFCGL